MMDSYEAPVSPEPSDIDMSSLICGPATPYVGPTADDAEVTLQNGNNESFKATLFIIRLFGSNILRP
jgi:hypothetical protein